LTSATSSGRAQWGAAEHNAASTSCASYGGTHCGSAAASVRRRRPRPRVRAMAAVSSDYRPGHALSSSWPISPTRVAAWASRKVMPLQCRYVGNRRPLITDPVRHVGVLRIMRDGVAPDAARHRLACTRAPLLTSDVNSIDDLCKAGLFAGCGRCGRRRARNPGQNLPAVCCARSLHDLSQDSGQQSGWLPQQ